MAAPLAVVDDGELDTSSGPRLLARQHGLLVALPHLGCHHVQDALADLPQVAGVVPGGKLQQGGLCEPANIKVDVRRERVDRLDDDSCLLRTERTRRQRLSDVRVLLERPAEREVATCLTPSCPRPDRQPRRGVAQPVLLAHVVGGGEHRRGERVELGAGLGQGHQRRLLLPHRHERRLDRRDALQGGLDVGGTADDGMHSGHLLARAHWTPPGSGAER